MVLILLIFLFLLIPFTNSCESNPKDADCSCRYGEYKRADFGQDCKKENTIISQDSKESLQCEKEKNCVAFDLLIFDKEKCGEDQITYSCWRQPIFT